MLTLVNFMTVFAALALGFSIGYNARKKEECKSRGLAMSNDATETDTYYAVELRSKKAPEEGWCFTKDSYGNVKYHDTVESAREAMWKKKAILFSYGFSDTKEFRIVKITKVVVE